jgi:hypothetical protein
MKSTSPPRMSEGDPSPEPIEMQAAVLREPDAPVLGDESVSADAALEAAVAVIAEPLDEGFEQGRGSLIATHRLLLEGARRPAMQAIAARWNEVYLLALVQLLERAGSEHPRADAELLLCAVDGLIVEELASGASDDPRPRLRRLVHALVDRR